MIISFKYCADVEKIVRASEASVLIYQSLTRAMHGKAIVYKDVNYSFSLPL